MFILAIALIKINPDERLGSKSIQEIKSHAFLSSINPSQLLTGTYRYVPFVPDINKPNFRDKLGKILNNELGAMSPKNSSKANIIVGQQEFFKVNINLIFRTMNTTERIIQKTN